MGSGLSKRLWDIADIATVKEAWKTELKQIADRARCQIGLLVNQPVIHRGRPQARREAILQQLCLQNVGFGTHLALAEYLRLRQR